MKDPLRHDPLDALGEAYEKMYERVVENFHHAEEKTGILFHKLIEEARDKAVELKELSEDDAQKVSDWLKRDVTDAANYLSETGHELKDWLGFETILIESAVLDLLLKTADETTVKLLQMKEDAQRASTYHTGEVTGPGTLVCDQCGEKLHFHRAGKIPPCPKCHATVFHR
jgi:hypothetical protein